MTRDFTYRAYADLLDAAVQAGFEFLTVREYLTTDPLPPRFLVLRHDVVRKPSNALDLARIEADRNVRGTYYVRTVGRTFDPVLVRALESLGHEVGYCDESLERADGDRTAARRLFESHLSRLRVHATVDTVCSFRNPLTPHDDRAAWDDADLAEFGLIGAPDRIVDGVADPYFSDDGRTWRDERARGSSRVDPVREVFDVETTADLADLFRRHRISRAWLHVHPNRWADSYPEFVATRTRDAAVQAARRGLQLIS